MAPPAALPFAPLGSVPALLACCSCPCVVHAVSVGREEICWDRLGWSPWTGPGRDTGRGYWVLAEWVNDQGLEGAGRTQVSRQGGLQVRISLIVPALAPEIQGWPGDPWLWIGKCPWLIIWFEMHIPQEPNILLWGLGGAEHQVGDCFSWTSECCFLLGIGKSYRVP